MNRNEQTEKILTDAGVKWETMDKVQISAIDMELSIKNQSRAINPILHDQVSVYKNCLENGDVFPPIVLLKRKSCFEILDGNNRITAAIDSKMDIWPFGAYVVEGISDAQYRMITYSVNNAHGVPSSVDDRVFHAIYFIDNGGLTIEKASKMMKVSSHIVQTRKRAKEARARAEKLNLNVSGFTDAAMIEFNILKDDVEFSRAIEVFGKDVKNSFYRDDFEKIKNTRNHSDRMSIMYELFIKYKKEKREAGVANDVSKKMKTCAARSLTEIKKLYESIPSDKKMVPDVVVEDILKYCFNINDYINKVIRGIEK